jgi:hypothetical protein
VSGARYPLSALRKLREREEAGRAAALARAAAAARLEAEELASRQAAVQGCRSRIAQACGTAEVGASASLAAPERFRQRLREERVRLEAAAAVQAARLASAEAALGRAREAHAAARAALRAVEAHRDGWLAGRRAAREAAEERERDAGPAEPRPAT